MQADGSAIGTGGSRLTADRFDQSVDRAAERIAAAQKLEAKGLAQPGKAGDLIARVYDYTRPGGSSARYAFAFRGHTEYSIACFWDPAHAKALQRGLRAGHDERCSATPSTGASEDRRLAVEPQTPRSTSHISPSVA